MNRGMADSTSLEVMRFDGDVPGRNLLILGAIHGNEVCGHRAIGKIGEELLDGSRHVKAGSVTLLPTCNPKALEANTRYFEENLNRVIRPHIKPDSYEKQMANLICPYIEACDLLLDLHAFAGRGDPFSIVEKGTPESLALARSLGPRTVLIDFTDVYSMVDHIEGHTTICYAHSLGKPAVTLECGHLGDSSSDQVAYEAIVNALEFIDEEAQTKTHQATMFQYMQFQQVFIREREGRLTQTWLENQFIPSGTVIARYADGEELKAPSDCHLIFSNDQAPIGAEWFYLVKPVDPEAYGPPFAYSS